MALATGGMAVGATRTKSSPIACALRTATAVGDFDAAVGKDRPDFGSANAIVNILHYPRWYQTASKKGGVNQTERQRTVGVRWLIPTSALFSVVGCEADNRRASARLPAVGTLHRSQSGESADSQREILCKSYTASLAQSNSIPKKSPTRIVIGRTTAHNARPIAL